MRLTIGRKLAAGFGLVILLLTGIGAVGFFSNMKAADSLRRINAMTADTALGSDATAAMLQARMQVKDFLIRNLPGDLEEYREWKSQLDAAVAESKSHFNDPHRQQWITEIEADLVAYDAAFAEVSRIIQERNRLRSEVLDVVGKRAADTLKQANYDLFDAGQPDLARGLTPALLDLLEGRLYVMKFLRTAAEPDYDRAHSELEHALEKLAALRPRLTDPAVAAAVEAAARDVAVYDQTFSRVHELVLERSRIVDEKLDKLGPHVVELQHDIQESLVADGQRIAHDTERQIITAEIVIASASGVAILLGIAASWLITRKIVGPIRRYVAGVERIGGGDLSQRLDADQRDEIGDMGQAINRMTAEMGRVIGRVREASVEVASAATEISATSEQMASSMNQQTDRVGEIGRAIEEMNGAVNDVAQKAADASNTSNRAGEAAQAGGEDVNPTNDAMNAISQAVT
ncbi:MAG: HAMP domain-containing protein, partial [Planctomycetota bacterium]